MRTLGQLYWGEMPVTLASGDHGGFGGGSGGGGVDGGGGAMGTPQLRPGFRAERWRRSSVTSLPEPYFPPLRGLPRPVVGGVTLGLFVVAFAGVVWYIEVWEVWGNQGGAY